MVAEAVTVDARRVAVLLEEWLAGGGRLVELDEALLRRVFAIRAGEVKAVSIDVCDRILVRIGLQHRLAEIAPPPDPGRRSGLWSRPHPSRKLTGEQIAAANRLHLQGGLSIRELGRQLWQRFGYASAGSCSQALSDAFRRAGLPRRAAVEQTVLRCTTHGLASKGTPPELWREHRGEVRRARGEIQAVPCRGETPRGACRRWARFGSEFCFSHEPALAEVRSGLCAAMRARKPVSS